MNNNNTQKNQLVYAAAKTDFYLRQNELLTAARLEVDYK